MKVLVILALFGCSAGYCAQAEYSTGTLIEDKFYPNPDYIHIDQSGIYVNLDGAIQKVDSLFSDSKGVYISKTPVNEWKCAKGHPNPPWAERCLSCPR